MLEYNINLLVETLKIYTPSSQESALSLFLADVMKELGFTNISLDCVNNVSGVIGNGSPSLLLCGHIDTVPGILPVKITDKHIFGRGSVDAKSSFVAMLLAASKLASNRDIGKVIVAGVVEEPI